MQAMKIALYGMPCAGKTTLLHALDGRIRIVNGSSWLNEATKGSFSLLPEKRKPNGGSGIRSTLRALLMNI